GFLFRAGFSPRSSRRDHGFREERGERTDPCHPASLHSRLVAGIALSAAVQAAVCRQFCLPYCAATARKPRRGHACIRRSARASAHFPSLALDSERLEETP